MVKPQWFRSGAPMLVPRISAPATPILKLDKALVYHTQDTPVFGCGANVRATRSACFSGPRCNVVEFQRFEPTIFQFLEELSGNNNRPWFQENKRRNESEVLEPSLAFIRAFAPRLKKLSPFFTADDRRVGGGAVGQDTRKEFAHEHQHRPAEAR